MEKNRKKLSIEQEQEMLEFYKVGNSVIKCAKLFNISTTSVSNYLKKYDILRKGAEKHGVSKKLELEVINYYNEFNTMQSCMDKYNLCYPTVRRIIKKHGEVREHKITKEIENRICELYENGLNAAQIEKEVGFADATIFYILDRNNIKRKSQSEAKRKNNVNDEYFDVIDTEDKAYILGWLVSDGWIKHNGLGITIAKEDEDILRKIIEKMEGGRIYYPKIIKKNKPLSRLEFTSTYMKNSLAKYGIIENKTHFTYFPDIPEHLWHHFIRGVFDGDGSAGIYTKYHFQPVFSIIGNDLLIKRIQEILMKECGLQQIKLQNPKHAKNNIIVMQYSGTNNFLKFRNYLYKDATIYLQRKYDKFFIEFEEKLPKTKYGNSYRPT